MAGEMAKLHGISKQTLLYYDRIGLLKPREISETNQYRYYTLDQFEELDVILSLKNLGMKLKEIKHYLNKSSVVDRMDQLAAQEDVIQKKISQLKRTGHRLKSILASLDTSIGIIPFEMGFKRMDKRYVLIEQVMSPFEWYDLEIAIKKMINNSLEEWNMTVSGFIMFIETAGGGDEIFKRVALELAMKSKDFIASGKYAYLYHKGPYEELKASRAQLHDFVVKSGFQPIGETIENVLLDSFAVSSEDDYLVEIQVLVE
jgi:DNA-binding transcriptional MerR regulator